MPPPLTSAKKSGPIVLWGSLPAGIAVLHGCTKAIGVRTAERTTRSARHRRSGSLRRSPLAASSIGAVAPTTIVFAKTKHESPRFESKSRVMRRVRRRKRPREEARADEERQAKIAAVRAAAARRAAEEQARKAFFEQSLRNLADEAEGVPPAPAPTWVGYVPPPTTYDPNGSAYAPPTYVPPTYVPDMGKPVHVNGYVRKDGTYVQPHTRAAPRR